MNLVVAFLVLSTAAHIRAQFSFSNLESPELLSNRRLNWLDSYEANTMRLAVESAIPEPLKIVLNRPDALVNIYDNITSPDCEAHLRYINNQLLRFLLGGPIPDVFILHMLDAWGKIPSGIFSGHLISPGDFDECIKLRGAYNGSNPKVNKEIRGSYCAGVPLPAGMSVPSFGRADPGSLMVAAGTSRAADGIQALIQYIIKSFGTILMFPAWGTCSPDSCSVEDTSQYLTNILGLLSNGTLQAVFLTCQVEEKPPLDAAAIAVIVVLAIIVGLCLAAYIADIALDSKNGIRKNLGGKILLSFSLYTNAKKIMSAQTGGGNLGCINGIRFLSISWVVLGHTYTYYVVAILWNSVDAIDTFKDWSKVTILNAYVAVDTFFVLSGTLVAYNILKELDLRKKLNVPMLYLHRYLRLTPVYIVAIGIYGTLLPYAGNGPLWIFQETESKNCRNNWWHNILYINTLISYDTNSEGQPEMCFGSSWYIANDMIYFILSPIFVYALWRWKKIGFGLVGAWISQCVIQRLVMTATYDCVKGGNGLTPGSMYEMPWTRSAPYTVGIILGYSLHLRRRNPHIFANIPKWTVWVGWTVSSASALAILMGPYKILQLDNAAEVCGTAGTIAYATLHRFAWGIVIAWIIFACVNGNGGMVNEFLSWKPFVPLARLSYCLYILSPEIQILHSLLNHHPVEYSTYHSVYRFLAHLTFSLLVSFVMCVTVEAPFLQLEKLLFQPLRPQEKPKLASSGDQNGNKTSVQHSMPTALP